VLFLANEEENLNLQRRELLMVRFHGDLLSVPFEYHDVGTGGHNKMEKFMQCAMTKNYFGAELI
jgi:hypothetical protein